MGWDDYLAVTAFILQIIFTALTHVSTGYGLGRLFAEVGDPETYVTAVKWELFAHVPAILMSGVSKCSVAVFLLRIIRNKLQIRLIWFFIGSTAFIAVFTSIVAIVQCEPLEKGWNRTLIGYCRFDFPKLGLFTGTWYVVMDFAFAIFPWFVIWGLNMKRKEKITVACGLSLGVFAGICGILRTVSLIGLDPSEYMYNTVPMMIWSATENLVTLMCSSIPVFRPLYVRIKYGSKDESSSNSRSYNLNEYGNRKSVVVSTGGIGQRSGTSRTVVAFNGDNISEEAILRDSKDQNIAAGGIKRTDEISVSYEARGMPN
ncbi:hypothetical protein DL771_004826 [Monosporascus sp. 5C6A]|nr:hypothetical protein DL771_004826 [Monosporascus sp. 5C6A]